MWQKYFLNPKQHKKKKINYLRTQRFKTETGPLACFQLDSVREVLHVLTVRHFVLYSAAEFRSERNLFFFILETAEIVQHSHWQNSTYNSDRAGSFYRLLGVLKSNKFSTATIKILCHPSRPTDFFTTQILGGHVWNRNKGLSLNNKWKQRGKSLGTRS